MLNMFSYDNNVRSTLSAPLAIGATTASLHDAPAGAKNPKTGTSASKPARFTIMNRANNPTHIEIIEATGVSGVVSGSVTLSNVTRGLEGTTARAWPSGSIIVQSVTAGMLNPDWSRRVSDHSDQSVEVAGHEFNFNKTWALGNFVMPSPSGSFGPGMMISGDSYSGTRLGISADLLSSRLMRSSTLQAGDIMASAGGTVTALGNTTLQPGEESGRVLISKMRISPGDAPVGASAPGTAGDIRVSGNYIYVCTSTNTWRRATLASW